MGMNLSAWLNALLSMLPPSSSIAREPNSVMSRFFEAVALGFERFQTIAIDVVAQFDPRVATVVLDDWDRLFGLSTSDDLLTRQAAAYEAYNDIGGQSIAYYTALAARLGESITITEFLQVTCEMECDTALSSEADGYLWRVNIPYTAKNASALTCDGYCDAALQSYTPSLIEDLFLQRKPAHTQVIFAYKDI